MELKVSGVNASTGARVMLPLLIVVATVAWLVGGVTADITFNDELIQLVGLPLLVVSIAGLLWQSHITFVQSLALSVAALIACVPLLQLLPLPIGLWLMPAPREVLATDLELAGIALTGGSWSLMPSDTERSLWTLIPAMALFLAALQLTERHVRMTLRFVLGLVLANLAFSFFQVGLPPDSALRLYPNGGAGFGGVLRNGNHQASALMVGMSVGLGLAADARQRLKDGKEGGWHVWLYATVSVICFAAILLTRSTAGVILAMVFFAAGCLILASWSRRAQLGQLLHRTGAVASIVLVLTGGFWAIRWMDLAQTEPLRYALGKETWRIGAAHFPWGSGIGTFVPIFDQSAPARLQADGYINHAHNEFAQWWMTGGLLAVLALSAALVLLAMVGWMLLRDRHRNALGVGCWLSVCAVLAHSWVDYPLRTLSLMSMTALVAGLSVAMASRAKSSKRRRRDAAPQRA